MKKIFLSLLAIGFSVSLSFAQTAEPVEEEGKQEIITENMVVQGSVGRSEMDLASLPKVVREAYQNEANNNMELVAVYKQATEIGTEPVIYEFEFEFVEKSASKPATAFGGLEIERVSVRQPDLIMLINEDGEIVEEQEAEEIEE